MLPFRKEMRVYFMDAEFTSMLSPNDNLDYVTYVPSRVTTKFRIFASCLRFICWGY